MICRGSDALNCQHDVVLGRARIEASPDTASEETYQAENIDYLAAQLHRGGDPYDVEEAQEQIVHCATAIHVVQAHAGIFRYQGPARAPVILAEREYTGVKGYQEE